MNTPTEKAIRLWYGWHGYTLAEKNVGVILARRLNEGELLADLLSHCPKMPPRPAKYRRS